MHAHHGTDHVAIDVDVAATCLLEHVTGKAVNAAVDTQGQSEACSLNLLEHLVQVPGGEPNHVQYRTKHLALETAYRVDLDDGGGEERAGPAGFRQFAFGNDPGAFPQGSHMRAEHAPGFVIDYRPDIGRRVQRIADGQGAHGSGQHGDDDVGDLLLQIQHPQRRAALPGALERRDDHVVDDLFRQRGGVDQHDVLAAGLRDQGHDGPIPPGELPVDEGGCFHGPRKGDTGDTRVADEWAANPGAVTGQQVQHALGHARLVQQAYRFGSDQRRLLRWFGRDAVAGRKRGADLAHEDCQGKVPRADTGEDTAPVQAQLVAFSGRPGQMRRCGESPSRLHGVITAEIDGFANFGQGILQGTTGLRADQPDESLAVGFQEVRRAFQDFRAVVAAPGIPMRLRCCRRVECGIDVAAGGLNHRTRGVFPVAGAGNRDFVAGTEEAVDDGPGPVMPAGGIAGGNLQALEFMRVVQIDAARVGPLFAGVAVKIRGRGDVRVTEIVPEVNGRDRVLYQIFDRRLGVKEAVDEGTVGAVFEQATHQIGQQVAVRPHGSVHSQWQHCIAVEFGIEQLSHAVQALKLESVVFRTGVAAGRPGALFGTAAGYRGTRGCRVAPGRRGSSQFHHQADRLCVVARKLRKDGIGGTQQPGCAHLVAEIGVCLSCKHRVVGKPLFLGMLDFGIPVGPFHQAYHQASTCRPGQGDQPVGNRERALLVGLQHEAEAIPARQVWIARQRFEKIQRRFQPRGFFGIDAEAQSVLPGLHRQVPGQREQFRFQPLPLGVFEARVQRGELDGNTVVGNGILAGLSISDRLDGV